MDKKENYNHEKSEINSDKDEVNIEMRKLDEKRKEIEIKNLLIPEVDDTPTQIFEEDKSLKLPAGLKIDRDITQNFQHIKYEFISIALVNLTRCTSDKIIPFKSFLDEVFESKTKKVILDITLSDFVDSTFFGVMVSFLKRLKRNKRKLKVIVQPSRMKSTTFIIAGLDRVFTFEENLNQSFYSFYNE